jgi:hypothetical protein
MELQYNDLSEVVVDVSEQHTQEFALLSENQLALVGGGIAEVILG